MIYRFATFALLAVIAVSCTQSVSKTEEFVSSEFATFPESRFVDVYKSFFQDAYGPGHLIPDTLHAGMYLSQELQNENWPDTLTWQATGIEHDYYRINLVLVKNGTIPRDTLLLAMLESATLARKPEIAEFKKQVNELYEVVKKQRPNLPDLEKDKAAIDAQLEKGEVMMHHSEHYLQTYQRRYRIVHHTVFERWKNTYLKHKY
jgi:hypothetical protein